MTNYDKLGKCCYSEAGERCGCQRYRMNFSNEHICDVCFHDAGFHEKENEETIIPAVPAASSLLNQVLAGRALEEESIANELSQTFSHRNSSTSTRSRRINQRSFDPSIVQHTSRNRNRREVVIREPRETPIQIILLPDVGQSLQSPMATQDKYRRMYNGGYIKEVIIKETDNIIQKIEETFPILLEREWTLRHSSARSCTMEYNPPVGQNISYALIKRLLVNKTKLYISPKTEPLPLSENITNIVEDQQQDNGLGFITNNTISSTAMNNSINNNDLHPTIMTIPSTPMSSSSTLTPFPSTLTSSSSTSTPFPSTSMLSSSSSTSFPSTSTSSSSTSTSFPSTSTLFSPTSSSATTTIHNSSSSYNTPVTRIYNSSTPSSSSTIRSNQSIIDESTSSFHDNVDDIISQILIQLQMDHKVTGIKIITIKNTINVVDEILDWIEKANDIDLLKKPMISVITESVIDVGGVFMHVTQQFWDQIKLYDDPTFFISNDDVFIISSNPLLLNSTKLITLGKTLFWCLIHNGAWPHWLHKFHFRYMFEMNINYVQILKEIQPQIYEIIRSIENLNEELKPGMITGLYDWGLTYNLQETDLIALGKEEKDDLINFIAKHEVENSRKSHLNELRNGFNIFTLIKTINDNKDILNINWKDFEKKLYKVVISEIDLLNQFDNTKNFKRIDGISKREILYSRFLDFLRSLKTPAERQNVLRFICGKIAIPLPINQKIQVQWKNEGNKEQPLLRIPNAKTCLKTIWLSENYNDDEIDAFDDDLRKAVIFGINDGFAD